MNLVQVLHSTPTTLCDEKYFSCYELRRSLGLRPVLALNLAEK